MVRVFQETFLNDHLLKKEYPLQPSTIQRIWHHPLGDLRPDTTETSRKESGMKRESLTTSIQQPHLQSRSSMLNHTCGTYSHNGVMKYPTKPFTEWNLGTFPHSMKFQSWKVNFRTEVCLRTADPQITMLWIKEVEIPESIDELLMTSRSITGRHDFPDYDMFDAMIASALKKFLNTHIHFRKKVSVEDQRAQKSDRFLRGKQISYMVYEYFRATGADEAVQGLSTLFAISLQNDDVQDVDVRCDQALLSGRIEKVKISGFCLTSNCVGFV